MSQSEKTRFCSRPDCELPARTGQRYCPKHHAEYMRGWRAKRKREMDELAAECLRLRQENRALKEKSGRKDGAA